MNACRIIVDPPADGAWNMAVDETLLAAAAAGGPPTLRFYQWREPTLSLGYFQAAVDRTKHLASLAAPLVRRSSGGGAIIHDRELTYSLALPPGHALARNPRELYRRAHATLIAALARFGAAASLVAAARPERRDEPFLCFARRAEGDVLLAGAKIAGSAQRRRAGAVLLHGSVLLARSDAAPELPGVSELTRAQIAPEELTAHWRERLAELAAARWTVGRRTPSESAEADALAQSKYSADAWTRRR